MPEADFVIDEVPDMAWILLDANEIDVPVFSTPIHEDDWQSFLPTKSKRPTHS